MSKGYRGFDQSRVAFWVAVVVGGACLCWYIVRKRRGPATDAGGPSGSGRNGAVAAGSTASTAISSADVHQMRLQNTRGWKVCVTVEACFTIGKDGAASFANSECETVVKGLASSAELFVFVRSANAHVTDALAALAGIPAHRVLRCTTERGYEAFARQLVPELLITGSGGAELAKFLAQFLPRVIVVGSSAAPNAGPRNNVAFRATIGSIFAA